MKSPVVVGITGSKLVCLVPVASSKVRIAVISAALLFVCMVCCF